MEAMSNLTLNDRKLVVGIDFGTTFSGVAWAETRRSDYQSLVEIWPANVGTHEGMSSPKVPTELRYTPKGIEWGFQIPPLVDRNQWFKLGLSDGQTATGQQKSSEELTTDYLTKLCEHLMYTLDQKLGASILRTIPIEFCLTVPAIWSEVAKEKTLKACQKAGLKSDSEILLVSEPEAAAIYALQGLDPHGLKIGETFILCDAGGGTVDLISYTITNLKPILKVREAAPGSGGLCGSTFLNRRFGEFLVQKLGQEKGWDDEVLAEAMERFDSVFSTSSDLGYTIPVPGLNNNEQLGVRRGRFNIKAAEVKGIFDPIVDKIIKLVNDQIRATSMPIRAVLLVGGFGQNNYLKERLRISLRSTVQILQPPNAWTAVVRGAVMMGLARSDPRLASVGLESRAARKHYGAELSIPFDEERHQDSEKFWCPVDNIYRVHEVMWFIKKGEPVDEGKPIEIPFVQRVLVSATNLGSFTITVWCDELSAVAPVHKNSNGRDLVTLTADISNLSMSDLRSLETNLCAGGNDYYHVPGSIEATFYSASTKYMLVCKGQRYDTVTAEYV
ncbi:actin-like ATPase domain-containing protein [Hyaloscypha variabilis F]|uniref:Actin-like ATPase domain-containing protein n=1 Tax=Hyaloscypha variabilis (strain UAMH 11265 / GT02V1 / F) TaxID=1149755 RepID=A0A2J6RPD8_HYAVF|nr:actin-like ATPase domain-containing protein [Hyaloscypha variabilis F]